MHCAVGLCGHCQLRDLFVCRDGPGVPAGRDRAAAQGARAVTATRGGKPTLAVWKFASCDGCQLSVLDLRGRAAGARRRDRDRLLPGGRGARRVEGPYDLSLVEGSITTPGGCPADPDGARAVAAPGDDRRLRDRREASRRCATSPTSRSSSSVVYASPEYVSTLDTSTPISDHVHVDFELQGCPINKRQLLEVISAFLNERRPAISSTASAWSASAAATSA